MSEPTWDILIATVPHRHAQLCEMLAEIGRQWQPGLGVIVYRDNLEHLVGAKRQALMEASRADYLNFVDDDDTIHARYVSLIMAALASRPDYVGFRVTITWGGRPFTPAEHSLQHGGWHDQPYLYLRDISHLNPIRREVALTGNFGPAGHGEDRNWTAQVREAGQCRTEVFIGQFMYLYRFDPPRSMFPHLYSAGPAPVPFAPGDIPPLPEYPWMTVI